MMALLLIASTLITADVAMAVDRAGSSARLAPVDGHVARAFEAPQHSWSAGHRGTDLRAEPGTEIRAAAEGTVSWVGTINSVTSVTISHADGLRTTYQPIDPQIAKGDRVSAGQALGRLLPGHGEPSSLHWGLLRGDDYLDPMAWLAGGIRGRTSLLPGGTRVTRPAPPGWSGLLEAGLAILSPSGTAVMPAQGTLSSAFGSRVNPVLGTTETHDGLDIAAACGTVVRAAWSGTVSYAATMSGFGNRVEISHGHQARAASTTSYNHMSDAGVGFVKIGQQVQAGQVIGLVGSTGLSTGCHLHFSTYRDGTAVDPMVFL